MPSITIVIQRAHWKVVFADIAALLAPYREIDVTFREHYAREEPHLLRVMTEGIDDALHEALKTKLREKHTALFPHSF